MSSITAFVKYSMCMVSSVPVCSCGLCWMQWWLLPTHRCVGVLLVIGRQSATVPWLSPNFLPFGCRLANTDGLPRLPASLLVMQVFLEVNRRNRFPVCLCVETERAQCTCIPCRRTSASRHRWLAIWENVNVFAGSVLWKFLCKKNVCKIFVLDFLVLHKCFVHIHLLTVCVENIHPYVYFLYSLVSTKFIGTTKFPELR